MALRKDAPPAELVCLALTGRLLTGKMTRGADELGWVDAGFGASSPPSCPEVRATANELLADAGEHGNGAASDGQIAAALACEAYDRLAGATDEEALARIAQLTTDAEEAEERLADLTTEARRWDDATDDGPEEEPDAGPAPDLFGGTPDGPPQPQLPGLGGV